MDGYMKREICISFGRRPQMLLTSCVSNSSIRLQVLPAQQYITRQEVVNLYKDYDAQCLGRFSQPCIKIPNINSLWTPCLLHTIMTDLARYLQLW